MHWLKVEREFYNLDCITKVAYSLPNDRDVTVFIHFTGSDTPQQLTGKDGALFLLTIAGLEGCWAFEYPPEDVTIFQSIVYNEKKQSVRSSKKPKK